MITTVVTICHYTKLIQGFPGDLDCKESACSMGELSLVPGPGRSPGGGHGNPLQYSCLGNPMEREAWWATVHGIAKRWAQLKLLSLNTWYVKKC